MAGLDGQSLWRDEVDAIRFAGYPLPELLHTFTTPGQNGPLYFLLLRPWLALAGASEFSLRFFSVFFGTLTVALVYRLSRTLIPGEQGQHTGALAALLAATSPYLIWYSQEGKMYTLVVALVLASMLCYLTALRRGDWRYWLGYTVVTSACFYVHLIAALIIPVQVLIFFLGRWNRRARLRAWLLCLAVLVLPYLPLLTWQLPALIQKVDTGYRFFPLDKMLLALLTDYSLGVAAANGLWVLALFAAVALGTLLAWVVARPARSRPVHVTILLVWLLLPPLSLFLITLRRPMFTTRYLIFILPAYLLLLATGLLAVARRSRLVAGALLAALLVVNGWNAWSQARAPVKADYRAATYYVLENLTPDDLVLFQIPYGRYSFDYYLEQWTARHPGRLAPGLSTAGEAAYRWAEGLYTNTGMSPDEADRLMAEISAGSQTIWLVESEQAMWDSRALVHQWLDTHGTLASQAGFTRVAVYRYVLPSR